MGSSIYAFMVEIEVSYSHKLVSPLVEAIVSPKMVGK